MCVETARLRTTSPMNASRSYDSLRSSTHEECVNTWRARPSGSSSRRSPSGDRGLRRRLGGVRRDVVGGLADGLDLRRLVVRDPHPVTVLELDDELDEVQRIGPQVLAEAGGVSDLRRVDLELVREVRADALEDLLPSHPWPPPHA